jgi:hypothetical protein
MLSVPAFCLRGDRWWTFVLFDSSRSSEMENCVGVPVGVMPPILPFLLQIHQM